MLRSLQDLEHGATPTFADAAAENAWKAAHCAALRRCSLGRRPGRVLDK
jgi:hypothetical protein